MTHGQVAWVLSRGQQPGALLLDQLRYLRQLGVPFSKEELGGGRGYRIRYGFDCASASKQDPAPSVIKGVIP